MPPSEFFRPDLLVRQGDQFRTLEMLGARIVFRVNASDTSGSWSLLDYSVPPGYSGPPPHWHKETTEMFFVLEGNLSVHLNDTTTVLTPGDLVLAPPGAVHAFANPGAEPARFLIQVWPGGFENYFLDLAELIRSEPVWPPQDRSRIAALAQQYDTFPPPSPGV